MVQEEKIAGVSVPKGTTDNSNDHSFQPKYAEKHVGCTTCHLKAEGPQQQRTTMVTAPDI